MHPKRYDKEWECIELRERLKKGVICLAGYFANNEAREDSVYTRYFLSEIN